MNNPTVSTVGAASESSGPWPPIAVIIVTYRAAEFVTECLQSLAATGYPSLRTIVVDNASPDGTAEAVERWIDTAGGGNFELIETGANLGFAGGVNRGLEVAMRAAECDLFWILNPDTLTEPQTPFEFARRAQEVGRFAVIGGRVLYHEDPRFVQTDGGRLHWLAGTAVSVNLGAAAATHAMPDAETLDYISGASMFISREFIETAGLMPEHYFLYFEEIDWQLRRRDLSLAVAPEARVHHRVGASIGSAGSGQGASSLSVYFTCRNVMRFVGRWAPHKLLFAYLISYYKLLRKWGWRGGNVAAALRGLHGFAPPTDVRAKIPSQCWQNYLNDIPISEARDGNGKSKFHQRSQKIVSYSK